MGYKKTDFDPNYQMSGEDMRKHRRVVLGLVPLFLLMNSQFVLRDDSWDVSSWVMAIMWATYIFLTVAVLTGWAYKYWSPREEYRILDDEITQHNRASAMKWGWSATILAAVALFFILPFAPKLDGSEIIVILLMVAIVTTSMRFVLLDRDEDDEEE